MTTTQTFDLQSKDPPLEAEVVFLRGRLEQKDREIHLLLQRIALFEATVKEKADANPDVLISPTGSSSRPSQDKPPASPYSPLSGLVPHDLTSIDSGGPLGFDTDTIDDESGDGNSSTRTGGQEKPVIDYVGINQGSHHPSDQSLSSQEQREHSTQEVMVDVPSISSSSILLLSAAHQALNNLQSVRLPEPFHQTDTASIRRRYMALEKGPDTKQDLLFGNPEKLFQSTVVLDFEEDSPSFRRKLQAMDENVEGMRNHLQRLVSIIQKYIEAGLAFSSVGRKFASELMHLQGESWFTRLGDLAPALVRFGETFDEIQNYRDAVLMSLEATFLAPMREFVKRELKEVRDMKEKLHRAHEEYLIQLQKYLQLRRGTDTEIIQAKTQELIAVRRRYELSRFDLVNTLNQLETKKKFQLVERVLCALYAYLGFFHQGHGELANLEPSMRDLQHQLRLSRREFAKQSRIAEAKRMQLEVHLSSALKGLKTQMALDDWGNMFAPEEGPFDGNQLRSLPVIRSAATGDESSPNLWKTALTNESLSPCSSPHAPSTQQQQQQQKHGGSPTSQFAVKSSSSWSSRSLSISIAPTPASLGGDSFLHNDEGANRQSQSSHIEVDGVIPIVESSRSPLKSACNIKDQEPEHSRDEGRASDAVSSVRFHAAVKQGYLWKRSSNVRKDWKRRFFFIRGGKLSYQRENDPIGPPRADICDLLISTVRECLKEGDTRHTFEILSPGKRPYMLQAENDEDYQDWVKALRSQTENLLVAGLDPTVQSANSMVGGAHKTNLNLEFLEGLRICNPFCADCQARGPEWASINFGIMICIECSGIHRSLGVHISKVRSLTLDKWTRSLRAIMEEMGNARFNAIWEAEAATMRSNKPAANASREEREAWIRAKYLERAFISLSDEDEDGAGLSLYIAALAGNIEKVMWSLAHGADVNWVNERQKGRTAVHAACEGASLVCLELLYQNGANLDVYDHDESAPLDLVMSAVGGKKNPSMISYILSHLERSGKDAF